MKQKLSHRILSFILIICACFSCIVPVSATTREAELAAETLESIRFEYNAISYMNLTSADRPMVAELLEKAENIPLEYARYYVDFEQAELETIKTNLLLKIEDLDSLTNKIQNAINAANDYSIDTVCSDDESDLLRFQKYTSELLALPNLTNAERTRLKATLDKFTSLLAKIAEIKNVIQDIDTPEISEINEENVKKHDREALESAESTLLHALGESETNLTDDEKSLIDGKLSGITGSLSILADIREVERLFAKLPSAATIDLSFSNIINEAKSAYEALSEHAKSLIDPALMSKYNSVLSAYYGLINNYQTDNTFGVEKIFGIAILVVVAIAVAIFIVVLRKEKQALEA